MKVLEAEIIMALTLAGEPRHPTIVVAPWMAKAVRSLPIRDFKISYVQASGLISPEYTFGPTQHSVDHAPSFKVTARNMDGSHLSRGRLKRLAQATWFGERFIPHIWHHDPVFRSNLALSTQHLASVEEILWLGGFWYTSIDFDTVISGFKMLGKTKNIDWRFQCEANGIRKWINLEVKLRDSDIEQLVPGGEAVEKPFADISSKFVTSADDEINVAGITLFGTELESMRVRAKKWLRQNANVDCVILWNEMTSTAACVALEGKGAKQEWLESFLDAPTAEGLVPMRVRHPIEIR